MNPFVASGSEARTASGGWKDAWPDALAFAGGLAVAWFAGWETRDLVWSLWLSSLVVGYAMIVWMIFGPAVRAGLVLARAPTRDAAAPAAFGFAGMALGGLFLLAFFTVHFGMFHFVHSVFLAAFFPPTGEAGTPMRVGPSAGLYWEVLKNYWLFIPVAFVAERGAFRLEPATKSSDVREAFESFKRAPNGMMAPYRNVVRLHLLIFFFAFAHFARLENFLVYAVVYAVYFFPWRLVGRRASAPAGEAR